MSRAFVKEDSDAPPPPPLPRTVSEAPNFVTRRGARLIAETMAELESALGEASEAEVPLIERDLAYWRLRQTTAEIRQAPETPDHVAFSTRVDLLRDETAMTVDIVGEDEADPGAGRIAWTSPLARAIDGLAPGETTEFTAGGTVRDIAIRAVRPTDE